jgi:hypothetical protein
MAPVAMSSPSHRRATAVRLLAALWAAVVAVGAVEVHPAGAAAHQDLGDSSPIFVCGDGHDAGRPHVEAALAVAREHCPGCLHRLQTTGGAVVDSARVALPPPAGNAAPSPGSAPRRVSTRSGPSRAPPLS